MYVWITTPIGQTIDKSTKIEEGIGRWFKKPKGAAVGPVPGAGADAEDKAPSDPTVAVASTKDAVQASSFAQGPVAAPEEESQEHQVGVSEL